MCDNASHFHIARTSEILGRIGSISGWPGWPGWPGLAWAELAVPLAGLAAPGLPLCNFAMSFLAVNTHYILRYPRLLSFMLEKLPIVEEKEAVNYGKL